jgi:hypothetical protein
MRITERAFFHDEAAVLGAARLNEAVADAGGHGTASVPNLPRTTLKVERFIPLHMM